MLDFDDSEGRSRTRVLTDVEAESRGGRGWEVYGGEDGPRIDRAAKGGGGGGNAEV